MHAINQQNAHALDVHLGLDVHHEHEDDIHTGSTVSTPTKLVKKNDACQETSATSIFRFRILEDFVNWVKM